MTELANESIIVGEDFIIAPGKRRWKQAFRDKAMYINLPRNLHWGFGGPDDTTLGYRIMWFFWSADIWFGRFPLLKFIIGVNILVWILLWVTH